MHTFMKVARANSAAQLIQCVGYFCTVTILSYGRFFRDFLQRSLESLRSHRNYLSSS